MERRPGPVAALLRADAVGGAGQRPLVQDAKEVAEQDVLCVHGHIGLELALPPALGLLAGLEVLARQPQGLGGIPFDDLGPAGDCHVGHCHIGRWPRHVAWRRPPCPIGLRSLGRPRAGS